MKILILTAWYHPFIHPRAHRWTVLAEHWAKEGHEITVLTARVGDSDKYTIRERVRIHRVGFDSLKELVYHLFGMKHGRGRVGVTPLQTSRWMGMLEWVYKVTWKNIFFPDDACIWYFPAKRKLFQLLENEQFDGLITVSLPFTDHLLGLAAKSRFPDLLWLIDIGDPFSVQAMPPNNTWLYKRKNLRLERRVLESADAISVTTAATVAKYRQLFGAAVSAQITVIPPLFHPTSSVSNHFNARNSDNTSQKKLGYFGALYGRTRTPDAFLDLLTRTFQRRPDLKDRLTVHFFGEIFPEFYARLAANPAIHLHGLCSREATWAAMQEMDILVNIGNATDFQLPSKAVEYLAAGRPVLNVSQVENDPFAQFFEDNPLIYNLLIKKEGLAEADLLRWIEWLEAAKPAPSPQALHQKLKPYLAGAIEAQYLWLLTPSTPE